MKPTHLDLFSGIGGFSLAAKWSGFETVGFAEIDPYACRVLANKLLPTPMSRDYKGTSTWKGILLGAVEGERHGTKSGMRLQPAFVEWMMGYPIGYTELSASETPSSHKSPTKS